MLETIEKDMGAAYSSFSKLVNVVPLHLPANPMPASYSINADLLNLIDEHVGSVSVNFVMETEGFSYEVEVKDDAFDNVYRMAYRLKYVQDPETKSLSIVLNSDRPYDVKSPSKKLVELQTQYLLNIGWFFTSNIIELYTQSLFISDCSEWSDSNIGTIEE